MSIDKLYVITESPGFWGAEQSLLKLLKHAIENGFKPVVVTGRDSPIISELVKLRVEYVEYDFALSRVATDKSLSDMNVVELFNLGYSILLSSFRLRKIISEADLVLSFSTWQSLESVLAGWFVKAPCVLDLHDTFAGRRSKPAIRLLSRLMTGVISPSRSLLDMYGLHNPSTIRVVPRPIDTVEAPLASNISGRLLAPYLTVGIFGQIVPHKGILEFAQYVQSSTTPVRLLIVGAAHDTERSDYELKISEVLDEIGNGSTIVPRVADVATLMRECNVVANVSHHEAFGRTIVEGMSHGAIPLVGLHGGPHEIVKGSQVGYVMQELSDTNQILEDIEAYLSVRTEVEVRTEMWIASRRFDVGRVAQEYFDALRFFANSKSKVKFRKSLRKKFGRKYL